MHGIGTSLVLGPQANLSSGARFFGGVCLLFLLGMLLIECKTYVKTYENPTGAEEISHGVRLSHMVALDIFMSLLVIGAVWFLWHTSNFNYRTVLALVLTAANITYATADIFRMRKYGMEPRRRSKRGTQLCVANNVVEIILVLLLAIG